MQGTVGILSSMGFVKMPDWNQFSPYSRHHETVATTHSLAIRYHVRRASMKILGALSSRWTRVMGLIMGKSEISYMSSANICSICILIIGCMAKITHLEVVIVQHHVSLRIHKNLSAFLMSRSVEDFYWKDEPRRGYAYRSGMTCSQWKHTRAAWYGFYYQVCNKTDPHMISHYL